MHIFTNRLYTIIRILSKNWKSVCCAIFLLIATATHLNLVSRTFFFDDNHNIHTSLEGYGDIPLHLSQISHFAFQSPIAFDEPIYYGSRLSYPFLINFISGMLLRLTGAWTLSVMLPVYFFVIANMVMLWFIYRRFLGKRHLAIAAIILFFLGSGLTGYKFLSKALIAKDPAVAQELSHNLGTGILHLDAKAPPDQSVDYGSPITLVFIHQRTFFIGFGLVLLFIILLDFLNKFRKNKWLWITAGIALGILPIAHTHSFVVAVVYLGILLAFSIWVKDWENFRNRMKVGIVGFVLALPQLWFLLGEKSILGQTADFAQFRLGWMVGEAGGIGTVVFSGTSRHIFTSDYLSFLWLNFGLILPLFVLALFCLYKYRDIIYRSKAKKPIIYALSAIALFVIVQMVKFQPWDFDNNKFLVYVQLFAVPVIIWALDRLLSNKPKLSILVIYVAVVLSSVSGILDLVPRLAVARDALPVIFTPDDQSLAAFVRSTNTNDLFLTPPEHPNAVVSLAGRPLVEGYPGWLWTRGINYGKREDLIRSFYKAPHRESEILKEFPIKYILLDEFARKEYGASDESFDNEFKKVFEVGNRKVYEI